MHPALAVEDIVRAIFRQITSENENERDFTYLSLALVQRSWRSLALDFLWETLAYKNFIHLARMMEDKTWYEEERYGLMYIGVDPDTVDNTDWTTPRFLEYCRRIRHIQWLNSCGDDLLDNSVLLRWACYAKVTALFPNLVTIWHLWETLGDRDRQYILLVNNITANSFVKQITVEIFDSDFFDPYEEYLDFIHEFLTGLPETVTHLRIPYVCFGRSALQSSLLNVSKHLDSLKCLNIGWSISTSELTAIASLTRLESLVITLSSRDRFPPITFPTLRDLSITINGPINCDLHHLDAPRLQTIGCILHSETSDDDLTLFTGLVLRKYKQVREILLSSPELGAPREVSILVRILEDLSQAHSITLHLRFALKDEDKSQIEALCKPHLTKLQLSQSAVPILFFIWFSNRFPETTDWRDEKFVGDSRLTSMIQLDSQSAAELSRLANSDIICPYQELLVIEGYPLRRRDIVVCAKAILILFPSLQQCGYRYGLETTVVPFRRKGDEEVVVSVLTQHHERCSFRDHD